MCVGAYPISLPCAVDRDERLELVEESEHRIATGFVGTPIVSDALTSTGHVDAAYDLLLETRRHRSWLYAVRQGATTVVGALGQPPPGRER